MTESNFERGTKAEARIAKDLKALYAKEPHADSIYVIEEDNGKNPDLKLTDSSLAVVYQIECKTLIHPIREGKQARAGYVKLGAQQVLAMVKLHDGYNISVLIAEIRSGGGAGRTVLVVPWQRVIDRWNRTEPEMLSLGLWWLLNNGVPLDIWWTTLRNEPLFKDRIVEK
jgi:hypothetical protein